MLETCITLERSMSRGNEIFLSLALWNYVKQGRKMQAKWHLNTDETVLFSGHTEVCASHSE